MDRGLYRLNTPFSIPTAKQYHRPKKDHTILVVYSHKNFIFIINKIMSYYNLTQIAIFDQRVVLYLGLTHFFTNSS